MQLCVRKGGWGGGTIREGEGGSNNYVRQEGGGGNNYVRRERKRV